MQSIVEMFHEHLKGQPTDDYYGIHATRFKYTLERCDTTLRAAKRVLELGGQSYIGRFAREALGASLIEYTEDLRVPYKLPDGAFDLVLALEVLEHIKDSPLLDDSIYAIGGYHFTGMRNLFSEAYRVLRPGGRFVITTPNATSLDVLFKVATGRHPHMFEPHVREHAPPDIFKLAADFGFELEKFDTFFAWTVASEDFRRQATAFLAGAGFDTHHRGDDAYFEFRKP